MNRFKLGILAIAYLSALSGRQHVHSSEATVPDKLTRLRAIGVRTPFVSDDGVVHDFTVPAEWTGNHRDLDLLQQYCERHNRSAHIRFLGPVITQDRLSRFRDALPKARIEHESAVSLGIAYLNDVDRSQLVVSDVSPNRPAARAGVEKDDLILGIGEYRWPASDSLDSFQYAIRKQIPGQRTNLTVQRNGEVVSLPIEW